MRRRVRGPDRRPRQLRRVRQPLPACERGYGACVDGVCVIEACAVEFVDCNGSYDDGCEVYCVPRISGDCDPATCTGPGCDTSCNNRDDDCNCEPDDCVTRPATP